MSPGSPSHPLLLYLPPRLGRATACFWLSLCLLTGVTLAAAPEPPPGYERPWSQAVSLDEGAVLSPPQMAWVPSPEGGSLRLIWTSADTAGLSLVSRTVTFREDQMVLGPASILRQGGSASPGAAEDGDSPSRPHQPLLVPVPPGETGEGHAAGLPRLVWVEGAPGERSLWMAPLDGERLGTPEPLAPATADARNPVAVAAPEGEPPGATLAWIEGTGGAGRLVANRLSDAGTAGPAVTVLEGSTVMAFALARHGPTEYGLALERTGERTAHLWSFRLDWSPDSSPQISLNSPLQVGLPERDRLDFTWAVSPEGDLYVLALLTLRDRSVLPNAYLFQIDTEGTLAPVQAVPIQIGSQPRLSWSRGIDLVWIAPDRTETWQVLSTRLDPEQPGTLTPLPVTAGWRGGFAPSALRDPEGYLHAAWFSVTRGGGWELLYRTDRVRQTTLLAERLASVANPEKPDQLLAFLGFFAFVTIGAFLPAQGPALLLVWLWERVVGGTPSRWLWLAGVLAADLASRVGLLPLWSPAEFDLGAWALTFRAAYLLPPLLVLLWLRWRPAQASTHRGRWEVALFYLGAQVAITAWPFTLWSLAGLG